MMKWLLGRWSLYTLLLVAGVGFSVAYQFGTYEGFSEGVQANRPRAVILSYAYLEGGKIELLNMCDLGIGESQEFQFHRPKRLIGMAYHVVSAEHVEQAVEEMKRQQPLLVEEEL